MLKYARCKLATGVQRISGLVGSLFKFIRTAQLADVDRQPSKLSVEFEQEKPTNCGTKAADVLDKPCPANLHAKPLNILVPLQLLAFKAHSNSKCCSSATAWPRFKGGFEFPNFWGLEEC